MKSRTITEENWQQIQSKLNDLIINNENLNEVIQEKNQENESLRLTIDKLYNTNKQLQKINQLVQHNYMTEIVKHQTQNILQNLNNEKKNQIKISNQCIKQKYILIKNNQKKIYEEEQLYGDTLKKELQESNKDKDMWKLRYFQLEEELQKMSNMEKEILKYIPIQQEFEEKQKLYDQQIGALKIALEERDTDIQTLKQQLNKKELSNSKKILKPSLNNTEDFENIVKQNKYLEQIQSEQEKKIEQLEQIIQNSNMQRYLQDQGKIEKQQKNGSQFQINSSRNIRCEQFNDENKRQQILDSSHDNRSKKMSFNTDSNNNLDDNIYSDDNSNNNRSGFKIEYSNNFGQASQQQNNDLLSPDMSARNKQPEYAGGLDNLDKKIDQLMRKQSRKISQVTDLGSMQNLGQDSVRGDNVKSSNNTSFSRHSCQNQAMRKGTHQTEDFEDLLNPRQNSSFSIASKSPRSININNAKNLEDDDKSMKNVNKMKNDNVNNISNNNIVGNIDNNFNGIRQSENRDRINSNNSPISINKQFNETLVDQIYKQQQDQIVNSNEVFLNDTEENNEVLQRIRLTSQELMQKRYQQQQLDGPSPKKKNSKNFRKQQKKRLSFQKELEINVYKSQNNSEEEEEDDSEDFEEVTNNEISDDIQLDVQNQNQLNRVSQDLNSKFEECIQQDKRQSQQLIQYLQYINNSNSLQKETNRDLLKEFMDQKNISNQQDKMQANDDTYGQEMKNNKEIENSNQQVSDNLKVFKGQEILENRIAEEIEKQLALQRRINMMDQEKVNVILLLQQKQEEVEKIHRGEILILEQKIEALERNSTQMQNLIVQYQIENQKQKEDEIDKQNEIDSKKILIEQLEQQINNMNDEIEQINAVKQKMKGLENQLKEKKSTISNLETQVSQIMKENEKLNEQQNNLQNQITYDMVDKDQLTKRDKEVKELKDQLEKIPSEYKGIVYNMQKTVDDIEIRMKEEQIKYQKNIQQMQKQHQEECNEIRVEQDTQMIKVLTTQEQMQQYLAEKHSYNLELESQNQILKNQNIELNTMIKSNQNQFTIQIEQINNEQAENYVINSNNTSILN